MTIAEIKALDSEFLTASQVAKLLGTDPNSLRWQARENPYALGFPVIVIKSRVKIPRLPFIRFMTGD
jgi:hypothetical protein